MAKIKITNRTKLIAIKKGLEACVDFFKEYEKLFFIELTLNWEADTGEKVQESAIVRKEIINEYYGVDFKDYEEQGGMVLRPKHKDEFLLLWEVLKANEPKKIKKKRLWKRT